MSFSGSEIMKYRNEVTAKRFEAAPLSLGKNIFQERAVVDPRGSPALLSKLSGSVSLLHIVKLSHPDKVGAKLVKVNCRRESPQP